MALLRTLFGRIALTIVLAATTLQLFSIGVLLYYVLVPLGQRATDDLAARMLDSARQYAVLPAARRNDFLRTLAREHELRVSEPAASLSAYSKPLPYYYFLERALQKRTGETLALGTDRDAAGTEWVWADIPAGDGQRVRVGFTQERVGIRPPLALLLMLSVGALVMLVTAVVLAHWLARPLARVAEAAARFGAGQRPERIGETGPEELRRLARSFNRMVGEVQELLDNRTVLLSGISHDLRTPLARIELAAALLARDADPALRAGLEHDIAVINDLIRQYLEIGRGLSASTRERTDVCALLAELAADTGRGGGRVETRLDAACIQTLDALALRRIVANLLDNALRYGAGSPVLLEYAADGARLVIGVSDGGPGIPPDQLDAVFHPFHRLEPSRSHDTGGHGLGLAIARQLALANGWALTLGPRPGGGTIACVAIPISEDAASRNPAQAPPTA